MQVFFVLSPPSSMVLFFPRPLHRLLASILPTSALFFVGTPFDESWPLANAIWMTDFLPLLGDRSFGATGRDQVHTSAIMAKAIKHESAKVLPLSAHLFGVR
ncbi:hypothetical protein H257_02441 [Aphanomyces astaci]|uniref:Uncharacterized protein n=1 Tax=Aphanomyces astaci TaxID=112090 RepID=W4H1X7_APHAT|nr:hypothetical protein H257_02441 [Aphanomyces astaci]ETV85912.1 hypothetical protein H257_02441 [Aphanomyces astaci]|eukprot:XP_009824384.1 hypothetical protein H257_02441 [Aphanomyces astaci]